MAVVLRAIGALASGNNPASLNPVAPGQVDDIEILVLFARNRPVVASTPAGWTNILDLPHSNTGLGAGHLWAWKRRRQLGDGNPTVNLTGGANGSTTLARVAAFDGVQLAGANTVLVSNSTASQQNIGPLDMPALAGANGMLMVVGAKADDWTSIATLGADAGLAWQELSEDSLTSGNDAGLVIAAATWSGAAPIPPATKTFVVTGGAANLGMGFALAFIPATTEASASTLLAQRATMVATASAGKTAQGVLAAQPATMVGVAERTVKSATANLLAQRSTVVASAARVIKSTSAILLAGEAFTQSAPNPQEIYAIGSTVDLRGSVADVDFLQGVIIEDIGTTAELFAGTATLALNGAKTISSIFASLVAQNCTIDVAESAVQRNGTGVLIAQGALFFGSSERNVHSLNAALQAGSASLLASVKKVVTGSGVMTGQGATVTSTEVVERKAIVVLLAEPATTSAVGGPSPPGGGAIGAGALLGGEATIVASAVLARNASGDLQALPAQVATVELIREIMGNGDLFGEPAIVLANVSFGNIATWEDDDAIWGQPPVIHARSWPMFVKGENFYQGEITNKFDKEPVRAILERTGLTLVGRDRFGNWKVDPTIIKFVSGVWPLFRGTPNTRVLVYVGGQMSTEEPITWEGPYEVLIGDTNFVDFTVSGRYISLRFESEGQSPWELISYDLELTQVGSR